MSKNLCAKTVDREHAYEVWATQDLSWIWYVLKKYQSPEKEAQNDYARWYCNVMSPMTSVRGELGDVYAADVKKSAVKLDWNPLIEPYRVIPDKFWGVLPMLGGDGYDDMESARKYDWREIGAWAKVGYDLGAWPYIIIFFREKDGKCEVAEYTEGDIRQWACPTEEARQKLTDSIAFWHWKFQDKEWVKDFDSIDQVPADSELRGPCKA